MHFTTESEKKRKNRVWWWPFFRNSLFATIIYDDNENNLPAEVGRVPKNCTQVKVKEIIEIFLQVKSKSNSLKSYLSKSKKVSDKNTTQVVSYYLLWIV